MPEVQQRPVTRKQRWAQVAFARVQRRKPLFREKTELEKYEAFCKGFPSLIHNCGLCQALAFAAAKGKDDYLEDLTAVLEEKKDLAGTELEQARNRLERCSREAEVIEYQRVTRHVIAAATWMKRYAEALLTGGVPNAGV